MAKPESIDRSFQGVTVMLICILVDLLIPYMIVSNRRIYTTDLCSHVVSLCCLSPTSILNRFWTGFNCQNWLKLLWVLKMPLSLVEEVLSKYCPWKNTIIRCYWIGRDTNSIPTLYDKIGDHPQLIFWPEICLVKSSLTLLFRCNEEVRTTTGLWLSVIYLHEHSGEWPQLLRVS